MRASQLSSEQGPANSHSPRGTPPRASIGWTWDSTWRSRCARVRSNCRSASGFVTERRTPFTITRFAPRLGFAWGLGHGSTAKHRPRAGFRHFLRPVPQETRFLAGRAVEWREPSAIHRYDTDFFPSIPSASELAADVRRHSAAENRLPDRSPHASALHHSVAVGSERQLTKNATVVRHLSQFTRRSPVR